MNTTTDPAALDNATPACDLTAMTPSQRERHRALIGTIRARLTEFEAAGDDLGLSFEPDPAVFVALAEWITLERLCCPFLGFSLELEPRGGPARLRLSGGQGALAAFRAAVGA